MTTRRSIPLAAAVVAALAWAHPASAVVYTVTSTADGAGVCPHATNCTLRTAITNANALPGTDALIVNPGVYNVGNQHVISDNLAIYAYTGVVLDGGGVGRIFEITAGSDVLMSKLELTGGRSSTGNQDGGAIYNAGDLALYDSYIHHNNAADDGAGIYTWGPLELVRTRVENNFGEGYLSGSAGGGINCYNTTVVIRDDSSVSGNTARYGGGIYAYRCQVSVEASQIDENYAQTTGGGAYSSLSELTISGDSQVNSNNGGHGAGLYLYNVGSCPLASCETTISGSSVDNNQAWLDGGGIRVRGDVLTLTLGTTLSNNISAALGGGLRADDTDVYILYDVDLGYNRAQSGGAIWASGGSLHLDDLTVHDNEGTASVTSSGGAVFVRDGAFEAEDSVFWYNEGFEGGSIHLKDLTSRPTLYSNLFVSDDAAYRGGSLYFSGLNPSNGPVIEETQVLYSDAGDDGGGIALLGEPDDVNWNVNTRPRLQRCAVDSNAAPNSGGGIFTTVDLHLRNTTLSRNQAHDGGGLYISSLDGAPRVYSDNVTIAHNSATSAGGGLYSNGSFYLANTVLADNSASVSDDCFAPGALAILSRNYNWIEDFSSCNMALMANDQVGLDPALGALVTSPSYYYSLPAASPLVNSGSCFDTLGGPVGADQIGTARPAGGQCDRGAIERP